MSKPISETAFVIMLVPLAITAVVAISSPSTIVNRMAGKKVGRVPFVESLLRLAALLLLIGAAITWHTWFTT